MASARRWLPHNRQLRVLIGGLVIVAVAAMGWFGSTWVRPAAEDVPSEELVRKLELSATRTQLDELFAGTTISQPTATATTIDFSAGKVRRLELERAPRLDGHISSATVWFAPGFEQATVAQRIRTIVPNRLQEHGAGHRIVVADAVLDLSPTVIKLWHWSSVHAPNDDPSVCKQGLDALWALLRWAALDGAPLTAAQVKLANGPTLAEAARVDTSRMLEQVVEVFRLTFPAARCLPRAGLSCIAGVDDDLVEEVQWQWPNALQSRIHQVELTFRQPIDERARETLAACVAKVLGPGADSVVDAVRNIRACTWAVGEQGDRVVLGNRQLLLEASGQTPSAQEPAWAAQLARIVHAVDECPRK